MAEIKISDEDMELVAQALWDETRNEFGGTDLPEKPTAVYYSDAKAVLERLAGRLLPPGGEVSTQFAALGFDRRGRRMPGLVVHHSLEAAQRWKERLEADRTIGKVTLAIHERQARTWGDGSEHYTPWSPVVSDNSEVPNAGD